MIAHDRAPEHEFEAAPGLPEALPTGERLLWQGAPDWRVLAREALHTRTLAVYFAVLLAWRALTVLSDGGSATSAGIAVLWLLPFALVALGGFQLMAWLIARNSIYTVTDRRVVMRIGVVLTITFNLPYAQVESAGLRSNADGSGDLTLQLTDTDHIAWVHLWPHVRPWQLKRTQPMLRALTDARSVAAILSAALADAAGTARQPLPAVAVPLPASAVERPSAAARPRTVAA